MVGVLKEKFKNRILPNAISHPQWKGRELSLNPQTLLMLAKRAICVDGCHSRTGVGFILTSFLHRHDKSFSRSFICSMLYRGQYHFSITGEVLNTVVFYSCRSEDLLL